MASQTDPEKEVSLHVQKWIDCPVMEKIDSQIIGEETVVGCPSHPRRLNILWGNHEGTLVELRSIPRADYPVVASRDERARKNRGKTPREVNLAKAK